MDNREKFTIRSSILELSENGLPRDKSIDDKIRKDKIIGAKTIDIWDSITALGAQLSRPPYDPYREIINLDISVGREQCQNKVVLSMPLIIYDNDVKMDEESTEILHSALNKLSIDKKTNLIFVSNKNIKDRKYPIFKRINEKSELTINDDLEGIILKFNGHKTLELISDIKKEFPGPVLVEVDDSFESVIPSILNMNADGIIIDTIKITNKEKYKGKHALFLIYNIRSIINQFYKGKKNDGTILIAAGDFNDVGKIVKAVAIGADIIGFSTSLLIANAARHFEGHLCADTVSNRLYKHLMATKGELKGVPAALGYSNFFNISYTDLRTSCIETSLELNIAIEGTDKTYRQIIEEYVNEFANKSDFVMDDDTKCSLIEYLSEKRSCGEGN
ncbi:MAG TPA: hypothetical protein VN704_03540 [Verrucomicrobiae bacterium]|nr:hypothetical protein [Verrucomicrobiae bacterium]